NLLGSRIKAARARLGLGQVQLAKQALGSRNLQGNISGIERGERLAERETIVALARVLQESPEYLLALAYVDRIENGLSELPEPLQTATRRVLSETMQVLPRGGDAPPAAEDR
ncbi:MAG: helix-turn-helix transcriptional regulator, partial [Patescibacteria group bacterium]|nr:helix-turn-helix transcriptional regulator [Patescibacteria group bacterium]